MAEVGGIESESFIMSWRLFIMTAIVIFIVLTVGTTFSAKQDVRDTEAIVLSGKIFDCISDNGIIKSNFNLDCVKEDGYYVNASLTSFESDFNREVIKGNAVTGVNCRLVETTSMKKYPSCLNQTYYVLIDNLGKIEKGKLELVIGVEKYSENLRL